MEEYNICINKARAKEHKKNTFGRLGYESVGCYDCKGNNEMCEFYEIKNQESEKGLSLRDILVRKINKNKTSEE